MYFLFLFVCLFYYYCLSLSKMRESVGLVTAVIFEIIIPYYRITKEIRINRKPKKQTNKQTKKQWESNTKETHFLSERLFLLFFPLLLFTYMGLCCSLLIWDPFLLRWTNTSVVQSLCNRGYGDIDKFKIESLVVAIWSSVTTVSVTNTMIANSSINYYCS